MYVCLWRMVPRCVDCCVLEYYFCAVEIFEIFGSCVETMIRIHLILMASDEGIAVRAIVIGVLARIATVWHTNTRQAAAEAQQQCHDVRFSGGIVFNPSVHLFSA